MSPYIGSLLPRSVCLEMLTSSKSYKVLRAIVHSLAIDVVDTLISPKFAAVRLFPHKAVLKNVAVLVSKMVLRHVNHNIPARSEISTAFPLRVCRSFLSQEGAMVVSNEPENMTTNNRGISATAAFTQLWRWVKCCAFLLQCLQRQRYLVPVNVLWLPIFVLWTVWDRLATTTATDRARGHCLCSIAIKNFLMSHVLVVIWQKARWMQFMYRSLGNFTTASTLTGSRHSAPPMWALYQISGGGSI